MGEPTQPDHSIKASERLIQYIVARLATQGAGMSIASRAKRVTTNTLQEMKANNEKIAMLTAYDFSLARLVDGSGIDVILVGDSASNVMAGHETTVPITLDQMIYHAQSVVRAVNRALVVVDMPFGTYQSDSNNALKSAIRIMKETGAHAVKLEGGEEVLPSIRKIIDAGIPVMGHLGLTPQSIYKFGTYSVRAKEEEEAKMLMGDAKRLEEAGCFSVVFEKIPAALASKASSSLRIPTIGIGAGVDCDGQVLVLHDMLGITQEFSPRFLRRYADLEDTIDSAISAYIQDVRSKSFPTSDESY